MKSATTSLCNLLAEHPRVVFSEPKEPEYFCREKLYSRGPGWYGRLFADAGPDDLAGEGSTSYTKGHAFPEAAGRIAADLPDAKLIFIARHPLDRIVSHWKHLRGTGVDVPADFNRAVGDSSHLVQTSRYFWQLGRYRDLFPDRQIAVYFFEDYRADPADVLRRCRQFLGLDQEVVLPDSAEWHSHRSDVFLREHRLIRAARAIPGVAAVLRRVPRSLREPVRRTTGTPMSRPVIWDPDVRARVADELREDARRFCVENGKPEGFWNL